MKSRLLIILALTISVFSFGQTVKKKAPQAKKETVPVAERKISITFTPYKNSKIYLGCYYGKSKIVVDSTIFDDKSKGVLTGNKLT